MLYSECNSYDVQSIYAVYFLCTDSAVCSAEGGVGRVISPHLVARRAVCDASQ